MKNCISVLSVFMFFFSCAPITTGIYDSNNKKKEPLKFSYSGSIEDANKKLKRALVENGFSFDNEDLAAGYLITKPKKLNSDECYNMVYFNAFAGGDATQYGTIKILYDTTDSNIICTVSPILSADATYREDAFSKKKMNIDDQIVPQGHPLAMKAKKILLNIGFKPIGK